MGRDGPVHHIVNSRRATALDAARKGTAEVSFAMDVAVLARIAMDDKVASCEGAVLDSLVSDMERDLVGFECAGESAVAVECGEADRLAFVRYCMHHVSLDSQRGACQVAGEAESLMHCDNRCVVVQNCGTRDCRALRKRDRAHSSVEMVIMVGVGRGCCGHCYGR